MATDAELTKVAHETATKMREFHQDDMKVMREYMDGRFEAIDRRFDSVDQRFDRVDERLEGVENRLSALEQDMQQTRSALQTLLEEFKSHRQKADKLAQEVVDLRSRVEVLEAMVQGQTA